MTQNAKFSWIATTMVSGLSLVIALSPGLWVAIAGAILLMVCFALVSKFEPFADRMNQQHWYYMIPLIVGPSVAGFLPSTPALWAGPLVALLGGLGTLYLVRRYPVFSEPRATPTSVV